MRPRIGIVDEHAAVNGLIVQRVDHLAHRNNGEHLDTVLFAQLVERGLLTGAFFHTVHGHKQRHDLHIGHAFEKLNALAHRGTRRDHIFHNGDAVAVLGL